MSDHGKPIISVDDPRLTATQAANAQKLIDQTEFATRVVASIPAAEAAGYTLPLSQAIPPEPAGSQAVSDAVKATAAAHGGELHLANPAYMHDGRELDPDHIESLVFHISADGGARLQSAMYILEPGETMKDAPDIAGRLTEWHDLAGHMGGGGARSGDPARNPKARQRAAKFPPMIHVWVVSNPCGPFANLEATPKNGCAGGMDMGH